MLLNKKILIAVTGSIAAYKTANLVRLLVKQGAIVKIVMTPAATAFITPLTLGTLSKNAVLVELSQNSEWANHVQLGRWANLMIIAPLSCNTLSKMAQGACDNLLLAVYLSATCPVVVAPAMDEDMWNHPAIQQNLDKVRAYGNYVIPVNNGELASGLTGEGRMAEPEEIVAWASHFLTTPQDLVGKKVLVTVGPTHEMIDPVRFISNASSGKMGIAIAVALHRRGALVTLIAGPVTVDIPANISTISVRSAEEMYKASVEHFPSMDWAIMTAAVADYTPIETSNIKIKKHEDHLELSLTKTKDILKTLGSMKTANQVLVGFALETNNEESYAIKKMTDKNADLIVLNSLNDKGAGFGGDNNKISIFDKKGNHQHFELASKTTVATDIINSIIHYTHA
jgi:phosphopantothenoylcysteine decarboxylase/phosphopantothenate--cysteine ligase